MTELKQGTSEPSTAHKRRRGKYTAPSVCPAHLHAIINSGTGDREDNDQSPAMPPGAPRPPG